MGTEETKQQLVAHVKQQGSTLTSTPQWLDAIRTRAASELSESGFPTTKQERWRYTNIADVLGHSYQVAAGEGAGQSEQILQGSALRDLEAVRLVLVDGVMQESLCDFSDLDGNIAIGELSEALKENPSVFEGKIGAFFGESETAFLHMNVALHGEGIAVHVEADEEIDVPIHVINIVTGAQGATFVQPRLVIVAENGASVVVIEHHLAAEGATALTNALVEVSVGDMAEVDHYRIIEGPQSATHVSALYANIGQEAEFNTLNMVLGGGLVRSDINAKLNGEGSHCALNGVSVVDGTRHVDHHIWVEHAAAGCTSHQLFKGVLSDQSRTVFNGRIYVQQGAQKTDAFQSNGNILLSDDAIADSNPELEIYADDVKCSHGSTIGQIDEDALMYMRSRGISKAQARNMLVFAFVNEVLSHAKYEPLAELLTAALFDQLPHDEGMELPL